MKTFSVQIWGNNCGVFLADDGRKCPFETKEEALEILSLFQKWDYQMDQVKDPDGQIIATKETIAAITSNNCTTAITHGVN